MCCTLVCIYSHMGWLQSVGSIKLEVSFAEYRLFYRALLRKRPIISSILPTEATPYPITYTGIAVTSYSQEDVVVADVGVECK